MTEVLLSLLIALSGTVPEQVQARHSFVIVVHESNPVDSLSAERLSKIFLRKVARWETGSEIVAVDQRKDAAVRASFSSAVHRRPLTAVVAYWQQQIFSGHKMPPSERAGDEAVLTFVRANAGAIGYVSISATIPPGVRIVPFDL